MTRLFCGAAALLFLIGTARAVEVDEEKKEEIVETVRKLVESHEKGDVTIEPRKAPAGRPAADERDDVIVHKKPVKDGKVQLRADLDLRKTKVSDALNAMGHITGITIILDPRAMAEVGDVPINLKVTDMPLGTALKWICRLAGLDFELRDGAIFVSTPARLSAKESKMVIYDIRDLVGKVEDFPGPNMTLDEEGVNWQNNPFGR